MKYIYVIWFILFGAVHVYTQAPAWQWAQNAGRGSGNTIASDASGNVYITGGFNGPFIAFGNDTVMNAASTGFYLAKYDASGNVIWATGGGGSGNANYSANGVSTDANGNVYITGYYTGADMIFGTDTLIYDGNVQNFFIAKYNSAGNLVWAKNASGNCTGVKISTGFGGVYANGSFKSPEAVFGNDTLTFTGNSNETNMFILKYDDSGNLIWAKTTGGGSRGISISTGNDGGAYVTAQAADTIIILGNDTLTYPYSPHNIIQGSFLVKYDSSGNMEWAKGMAGFINSSAITQGSVVVTGLFTNAAIIFGSDTLNNAGAGNFFVVRYDASGNVVWAKSAGGTLYDVATAISADAGGNSYVAGLFQSTGIVFGADTLLNSNGGTGNPDFFVAQYDSTGMPVWAKSAGISGSGSVGQDITLCTDAHSNNYLTGYFSTASLAFDSITLNNTGGNTLNIFVAKLAAPVTGIETIASALNIHIFPNPSTSIFYLTGVPTGAQIEIYNVLGEEIYSSVTGAQHTPACRQAGCLPSGSLTPSRENTAVNLAGESRGIYFYKVIENGTVVGSGKMVFE